MEEQQDIYLKFTRNGAKEFLNKIREKIPDYFSENDKKFIRTTERQEWIAIDDFLSEKGLKNIKKLFYDEIYLFYKKGPAGHNGEILLENLSKIIKIFFSEEEQKFLLIAESQARKSNDNSLEIKYGSYGFLILRNENEENSIKNKVKKIEFRALPIEITQNKWSLYSFWEENHHNELGEVTGKKRYGIIQSLVEFEENRIMIHYTNKFDKIESFEGAVNMFLHENQIYIETDLMPLSDLRKVRIMFLFGENINELGMSIFYNIRNEGALFSGSGLLVREAVNSKFLARNMKSIVHETADNQTISHFFERRSQNYLKLPRITEYNLTKLYEKLEILLEKGVEKDIRIYKHDFFISIPMYYVKESKAVFNKNKEFCLDTIKLLRERFKMQKYYFACENYTYKDYQNMLFSTHYENAMEGIAESKLYVLVIPDMQLPSYKNKSKVVRFSSALTELGYAIGLKKPILILCSNKTKTILPNIAMSLEHKQILIATPDMSSIDNIKDWFKTQSNRIEIDKFLREYFIVSEKKLS